MRRADHLVVGVEHDHAVLLPGDRDRSRLVEQPASGRLKGGPPLLRIALGAGRVWHGKLFHIDLNGQNGPRYDQDLRFGAGNARGAFWVVDALMSGGFDGPIHFDYKPPRTEDDHGVWASATACMRNYLILQEKVRAFRADPEVIAALAAARVDQLSAPTLAEGETWRDVAGFIPDIDTLGRRGMAFEHLDLLALEHLFGVRCSAGRSPAHCAAGRGLRPAGARA